MTSDSQPDDKRPNRMFSPGPTSPLSRRRFIQSLGAAGAVAAGGAALAGLSGRGREFPGLGTPGARTPGSGFDASGGVDMAPGRRLPGAVDGRVLVIVDLQGGNDGLSTLIPAGDPRYYDRRPGLAISEDEVLGLDDEVGLHPALARLHRRGLTTIEGVGPASGDLSHFAMTERWERGDVRGDNGLRTGFLGRLTDSLDDGSPLVGVSMAGPTAHLQTNRAATMALEGPDDLWFLEPNDWSEVTAYRHGVATFAAERGDGGLVEHAASSFRDLSALAIDLAGDEESEPDWEDSMLQNGGELGRRLYFAADLISADVGVRVVYVADGDYDTHQDHRWRQADNLDRLDAAVDGFLGRAEAGGFADQVLVATISEFGRRVPENDGGLDHGSASTMLIAGPVGDRRLGERPPLDDLDDDDNLRVTVGFDRYLAGLAENWLGVEASSVLPGEPEPLDLI